MSEVLESLKRAAADLTTLEINTIVKENMTARKMPAPGHAIHDIIGTYVNFIQGDDGLATGIADPFEKFARSAGGPPTIPAFAEWDTARTLDIGAVACEADTFRKLRRIAHSLLTQRRDLSAAHRNVLERIKRNSDQLKALLARYEGMSEAGRGTASFLGRTRQELTSAGDGSGERPPVRLLPDELTLVRKVWDVGVEQVVMQSCISLSGDVVNRVQSGTADPEMRALLEFHHQGIVAGGRMWKLIAGTVASIAGVRLSRLFS